MPFLFAIDAAYFLIAAVGGRSPPPLVASPGTSASPPSLRAASLPMTVRIVRVPCRFGGTRPYFICPGVVNGTPCGRRVVKLHGPGRYFLCRNCHRLAHTSQSEGAWDRALRRANTIRMRLGGELGMAAPFPPRPKGMWRRTYERLCEEAFEAEQFADDAFLISAEKLLTRIDKPQRKETFWP